MMLSRVILSLAPVLVLALTLLLLDSYKLVKLPAALFSLLRGVVAAAISLWVNTLLIKVLSIDITVFSKFWAPIIEEAAKASFLYYLIKRKRIGFLVDAAIHGAAIGAGFSVLENIVYLRQLADTTLLIWFVRGFGTAVMHSACTAMFGILYKRALDRAPQATWSAVIPSFIAAVGVHALFNQFLLPPVLMTMLIVITLPLLIIFVYENSERSLRTWLSMGMDEDMTMLEMILTGRSSETRFGQYLQSIRDYFPPSTVVDLFCYLRIYLELAIRAKGLLLLRQYGMNQSPDPAILEKLTEFKFLEKSIGKTGKLALAPFIRTDERDLWQLYMLGERSFNLKGGKKYKI